MKTQTHARRWVRIFAIAMAVALPMMIALISAADARVGRGGSFGSRGARTFTPPAATQTAPMQAQPMQRTITQPGTPASSMPATGAASQAGGMFAGRNLLGGLALGFLGAGLFGMLMGNGFFAGLGSFAGFLGLLLQIALIVIVARLAWAWWQRRQQQPAYAGPAPRDARNETQQPNLRSMLGGLGGAAAPVRIVEADYAAFGRLLEQIQDAWSNEDIAGLRRMATPEMVSYFAEDLTASASAGVVNRVSNVTLEQGDLAEAWREGEAEYATVAMRFSLVDQTFERGSGRLVEGSAAPTEATELWTFRRDRGGNWMLSAIQQTQ